ncbi:MAG: T9SS type A sorting domain-containing protein [Saprospiraceae bacterium]
MKWLLSTLMVFLFFNLFSQQTINGSLNFDGLNRTYILYVPASYTGDESVPLLFNFHGYGSNAQEQFYYADFRSIAEREQFLLVLPQGTEFNGNTHWNVGGTYFGSTTNDIGFTEALIDKLESEYNIDSKRIYSTGMSNGGYMSFHLACNLSEKIAAVASVTGAMTPFSLNNCDCKHPMPAMQIHGTNDPVVPYNGAIWTQSIPSVLNYWVDFNRTDANPSIEMVPNINSFDQSTAEHQVWANGDAGVTVEHFRIIGGEHTWPGSPIPIGVTNQDINACEEIWKFFSRYDLNGIVTSQEPNISPAPKVYPNPANEAIFIDNNLIKKANYKIFNLRGQLVQQGKFTPFSNRIDISRLQTGVYILKMENLTLKFIKN